jgi:hyperosmotically inducible protein
MSYKLWVCTIAVAGVVVTPTIGAAQTAAKAPASHAQKVDDSTLDKRIEARLKADSLLKKDRIDVSVEDGVATLTGSVHSRSQRARAERLAKIHGVSRVDNKLEVETAATTGEKTEHKAAKATSKSKEKAEGAGEAITDAWITTKVKSQFVGKDELKGSDINVDTNDHVVTLKGTVASEAGRTRAVEIAKTTKGVTRVVDELTIAPKK